VGMTKGTGSGTYTAMGATAAAGGAAATGLAGPPDTSPDGRGAAGPGPPAAPGALGALNGSWRGGAGRPEAPAAGTCKHARAQSWL